MAEQPVIVQKISWSDLCPWTLIFKTLPIASSVTVLTLALLGVVLTPIGWLVSERICINEELRNEDPFLMELVELNRSPYKSVFRTTERHADTINVLGMHLSGPRKVFGQFVSPFKALFSSTGGIQKFIYLFLGCAWMLFVWTFVGLAIARVALLRLTRNEQAGLDDAFDFSLDYWMTAAGAVGIPFIAIAVLCIPTFIVGLLMGFDIGVLIAGVLWFVVLGISAVIGLLLLGLMFGWPLMVSSVACEGQNSFDAMTRSYAYTFQRPLNYLFYMAISILFGGFCWLIVVRLTNGIVDLSFWSTSWGANLVSVERIETVRNLHVVDPEQEVTTALSAGQNMIGLWSGMLRTLAAAFIYGLFWCMASAIYLLLRKDVDETETDEIYLEDEQRTYELPPLQSDERGIPVVQEPQPIQTNDEETDRSEAES